MGSERKGKRGLGSMDEEKARRIQSAGGRAKPAASRSFKRGGELVKEAGRLGGLASAAAKKARKEAEREALGVEPGVKGRGDH